MVLNNIKNNSETDMRKVRFVEQNLRIKGLRMSNSFMVWLQITLSMPIFSQELTHFSILDSACTINHLIG